MSTYSRRQGLQLGLAALAGGPLLVAGARRARAATHQVLIQGFAFSPAELVVSPGDSVVFTNNDGAPHTATAVDGSFDTGRLSPGQSAELTVTTAGATAFRCRFHPSMTGTILAS